MDRDLYINRFKARLLGGDTFSIKKQNEFEWRVESKDCRIAFVFERYDGDCFMILVSSPESSAPGANLIILRDIRGARDVLPDAGSPENQAEIFNKYFGDILTGDFSLLKEQERLGKEVSLYLAKALSLDDDDPIKIKVRNYDISWLEDYKKRKGITS